MRGVKHPLPSIQQVIDLTIQLGSLTNPAICPVGIAVNTQKLREDEARTPAPKTSLAITGCPPPIRFASVSTALSNGCSRNFRPGAPHEPPPYRRCGALSYRWRFHHRSRQPHGSRGGTRYHRRWGQTAMWGAANASRTHATANPPRASCALISEQADAIASGATRTEPAHANGRWRRTQRPRLRPAGSRGQADRPTGLGDCRAQRTAGRHHRLHVESRYARKHGGGRPGGCPSPPTQGQLGGEGDPERIAAVRRGAPNSRLIVDANEAWRANTIEANLAACVAAGVGLIEHRFRQGGRPSRPDPAADSDLRRRKPARPCRPRCSLQPLRCHQHQARQGRWPHRSSDAGARSQGAGHLADDRLHGRHFARHGPGDAARPSCRLRGSRWAAAPGAGPRPGSALRRQPHPSSDTRSVGIGPPESSRGRQIRLTRITNGCFGRIGRLSNLQS